MGITEILIIVVGLTLFEIISSIDNAVINADVVSTMSERWRRWFLLYGIFFAVVLVRGLLPWLIIYFASPGLSLWEAFTAAFSDDENVKAIIERQAPILLAGGGIFLIFLFFDWLFLETKNYAFFLERHIHRHYNLWFYSIASLILLFIVLTTIKIDPLIALGAVIGSTAFFIVSGFKRSVEAKEQQLIKYPEKSDKYFSRRSVNWSFGIIIAVLAAVAFLTLKNGSTLALGIMLGIAFFIALVWIRWAIGEKKRRKNIILSHQSDLGKIMYLELLDATFSIDGVLGAFAFTRSVPLILIGNGIGAIIIRYFTVKGVKTVKKYAYLKNGAMYSVGFLGIIMILESLGYHVAFWTPPLITILVIGLFLYLSHQELKMSQSKSL